MTPYGNMNIVQHWRGEGHIAGGARSLLKPTLIYYNKGPVQSPADNFNT